MVGVTHDVRVLNSCFTWESPGKYIFAFIPHLMIYYFELYIYSIIYSRFPF